MAATLTYKFRGHTQTLSLHADAPLSEVAAALAEQHHLDASTLRLLGKGAAHQLISPAGGRTADLGAGPFMLLGTPAAELAELEDAAGAEARRALAERRPTAEHETKVNSQRLATDAAAAASAST